MEPVILILIALFIVIGAASLLVTTRKRRERVELEAVRQSTLAPGAPTVPPEVKDRVAKQDPDAPLVPPAPPIEVEGAPPVAPPVEAPAKRPTFRDRLSKARATFAGFLGRSAIDDDTWDELEEALIRADVGVGPATALIESLKGRVKEQGLETGDQLVEVLKAEMKLRLAGTDRSLKLDDGETNVWLFVGVNGVGKTTTIGKLGKRMADEGHSVVMAAGDTFRAAAAEQLGTWADRSGAQLVRGAEGGDPSAIIFDAIESAAAKGADLVLADTAGRLHTKSNLMEELRKVRRVADKEPGHVTEVLLVLDATTGQNGLVQARQFTEATEVTGVVLTKLDGSAKGGIVFAIQSELGIPVKLVGLGETAEDLIDFDPDEFVDALFSA
ncbi:signal recognition particle-docking protein FtsY [Aquihabitans daechungensis]|uniref:signal recognition particle-docking protein FtsY n=1 Tax=Aquihabitans daechungensis TaxID=1052257 RepID=UPI003B9F0C02